MGSRHTSGGKVAPGVAPAETYDAFFPEWSQPLLDPATTPARGAIFGEATDAGNHCAGDVPTGTDEHSTGDTDAANRLSSARTNPDIPLEQQCEKVLALLRKHCPDIVPPGPVPAGEVTPPIDLQSDQLDSLVLAAVGVNDRRRRNQVIWEQAGSELLVHLKRTRVAVLEGLVLIGVSVETVESGRTEVTVPFAVGRRERLAGMVVATEPIPRGPTVIIDRWGDSLIAFAWQVLIDVITTISARTGVDTTGVPLVPGAIVATDGALRVIPQAQHDYERPRR